MKRFAFLLTVCALLAADNPLEGARRNISPLTF